MKKQLNAEFDFAKTGFIEVDGFSYSKHDVLEEIEHPQFPVRLVYHKKIWQHKNLLALLENNSWNQAAVDTEFPDFFLDKEFDRFFSPYFASPFNYVTRSFLNEQNFRGVAKLFQYEDFLQPEEREEAFRSVRIFLDENLRLLRNVVQENYSTMRPKIKHLMSDDWALLINSMPHEFYDIKCDMAVHLINLTVKLQKSEKKDCKAFSAQLVAMKDMPENLRKTIVNNHSVYNKVGGGGSNWRWLIWVAFILIKVLAMGGC
jgi:hypothetical protein